MGFSIFSTARSRWARPRDPTPRRPLPAPLWAVVTLPFGLTVGFATIAAPFALRERGFGMTAIAGVSQLVQLPHVFKLLWSPALDAGARRRTWVLASVAAAAGLLALAAALPPPAPNSAGGMPAFWAYAGALFGAQAAVATTGSAVLALLAVTVPDRDRGVAAGWQTVGNLAGTSVGGAAIAWMVSHLSPRTTAVVLAAVCLACALPAAFVDETPPPRRRFTELARELARAIAQTLRSREGWTGLVICLSPVGTGALTNLFTALAAEYAPDRAGAERLVVLVSGLLGGIVNAVGALAGGYLADRMDRRRAYLVFGAATAACAGAMIVLPATPAVFTAGTLAYQLANGLSFSAFYAFVMELLGHREGVTTQLALYVGASNLAISYVTWLDGFSYDHARGALTALGLGAMAAGGRTAMLAMDAGSTFVGIALVALVSRRRPPRPGDAAAA